MLVAHYSVLYNPPLRSPFLKKRGMVYLLRLSLLEVFEKLTAVGAKGCRSLTKNYLPLFFSPTLLCSAEAMRKRRREEKRKMIILPKTQCVFKTCGVYLAEIENKSIKNSRLRRVGEFFNGLIFDLWKILRTKP